MFNRSKKVVSVVLAFSLLFCLSVVMLSQAEDSDGIVDTVIDVVKKGAKKVGTTVKKITKLDPKKLAIDEAINQARKRFEKWWEGRKPTYDHYTKLIETLETKTLPAAYTRIENAKSALEGARFNLDMHMLQLGSKKTRLGILESNLSAMRIAVAAYETIRDDITASPSARKAAGDEVTRLNGEIESTIDAITDLNLEIYNYFIDRVGPAQMRVTNAKFSLELANDHLKAVNKSISDTRTDITNMIAEKTKQYNQLGKEIEALRESLGE